MIDVAILGAGPYGLSAGAHLNRLKGLETRVFGETMSFWEHHMPKGMKLRSPWAASHLSDPDGSLTLDGYTAARGNHLPRPIPLERFLDYGKWFQAMAVPGVDRRKVLSVRAEGDAFRLIPETGEEVLSRRVAVAAGVGPFAYIPPELAAVPEGLRSHASDHEDLSRFAGKSVIVVGAGQSALESAALLREAGAEVRILARQPFIRFLVRSNKLHELGLLSRMLYAPADVGPAGVSRLVGAPAMYRLLPRPLHDSWRKRSVRPAGSSWLRPRLEGVDVTVGVRIASAGEKGGRVEVTLEDGTRRFADHMLLATGYRVDIARYGFLAPELLGRIARTNGYPRLTRGLESVSVPGLHFLGSPAAWTFGPLMQFVAGAGFAARELARTAGKRA
jgi:FAD-dependent urate hydroxylase